MKKSKSFIDAIVGILVKHKVVSSQDGLALSIAFKDSPHEDFDEFLVEEGLVDDVNILRALEEYYKVPFFDVTGYFFDRAVLNEFPKDFLLRNGIIPLERDGNILAVIASDPSDASLLAKIGKHVSYDIQFRVGLRGDICDAVKEFYDKALTEGVQELDLDAQQAAINEARNNRVKAFVESYDDESESGVQDTQEKL